MMDAVSPFKPDIRPCPYDEAVQAVRVLCAVPGALLLASEPFSQTFDKTMRDSPYASYPEMGADTIGRSSRWSVFAFDPLRVFGLGETGFLEQAEKTWLRLCALWDGAGMEDLPFYGGLAGLLSYEAAGRLEHVPRPPTCMKDWPDVWLGLYDGVVCFDHKKQRAFAVSWGGFAADPKVRQRRSQAFFNRLMTAARSSHQAHAHLVEHPKPQLSKETYEHNVKKILAYIRAGDLYQANFSQAFEARLGGGNAPYAVFERLITQSPAPFCAYLRLDAERAVATHTPERFFCLDREGKAQTQPIKGTRPRGMTEDEDRQFGEALLASAKDRAENLMIVDLMRHDFSRVCRPGTVCVPDLWRLERHSSVQHLVSIVRGHLNEGKHVFDLLRASFPPGSVTGAPKIRAMEVIAELEGETRGPYCGVMGYMGLDGRADFNVMIRTLAFQREQQAWHCVFRAGGGIVADSRPCEEYQEVQTKAKALHTALESLM